MFEFEPLNVLTARAMLDLCLARRGYVQDSSGLVIELDPIVAWTAYREWASLPSSCPRDLASFQGSWVSETDELGHYEVIWARELTGGIQPESADDSTRVTGIRVLYGSSEVPSDTEFALWADDFPTIDAFLEGVVQHPVFDKMQYTPIWTCYPFSEVLDKTGT